MNFFTNMLVKLNFYPNQYPAHIGYDLTTSISMILPEVVLKALEGDLLAQMMVILGVVGN